MGIVALRQKNQIVQHSSHFYPFLNIFSLNSSAPELSTIVVQRSEKVKANPEPRPEIFAYGLNADEVNDCEKAENRRCAVIIQVAGKHKMTAINQNLQAAVKSISGDGKFLTAKAKIKAACGHVEADWRVDFDKS